MLDLDLKDVIPEKQWHYIISLVSTQKIADAVFSCRTREVLIEKSLDAIMEFTDFDGAAMLILDKDEEFLECLSVRGLSEETRKRGKMLPMNGSFSGTALLSKKIISTGELSKNSIMYDPVRASLANDNLASCISIPLIFNDRPYGVLNIFFKDYHRELFSTDYGIMETIGKMISLALSNVAYLDELNIEIDNRKFAQDALIKLNSHLELMVSERTESLQNALNELQGLQDHLVEAEKMASLGSLVAGISHEINTPLGVSKTSASHIETIIHDLRSSFNEDSLTEDDFLSRLNELSVGTTILSHNIERAADLVRSFKQVAVDQSDERIYDFDIKDSIRDAITTLTPNWKKRNIDFNIDSPKGLILHNYPGAISQVFTNLINNSLIHGFEGSDKGTIDFIVTQTEDNHCHITYKDDGCGIDKSDTKKIFEPFYTTKRGNGGTGLGLHLLYNLVTHKMKGSITAIPLEQGLSFDIKIPLKLKREFDL